MSAVRLIVTPFGANERIEVNGRDIAGACRGYTLTAHVGEMPKLELELTVTAPSGVEGSMDVVVDDRVYEALQVLGWTPPDDVPAYVSCLLNTLITGGTLDFAGAAVPAAVQNRLRNAIDVGEPSFRYREQLP